MIVGWIIGSILIGFFVSYSFIYIGHGDPKKPEGNEADKVGEHEP